MTLGFLFTALGYATGAAVYWWRARERGIATEGTALIAGAAFTGGIAGAKITQWLVQSPALLWSHPEVLAHSEAGGRTLVGGILAGWLAARSMRRKLGIQRPTADLFALALSAGEAVGRIGCFFNTCCFGVPSAAPWACYQHGAWRAPVQVVMALSAAFIFAMLWTRRDRTIREGELFHWYLLLFGLSRFILEFWRQRDAVAGSLSLAQWAALALAVWGAARLYSAHQWRRQTA